MPISHSNYDFISRFPNLTTTMKRVQKDNHKKQAADPDSRVPGRNNKKGQATFSAPETNAVKQFYESRIKNANESLSPSGYVKNQYATYFFEVLLCNVRSSCILLFNSNVVFSLVLSALKILPLLGIFSYH